MVKVDFLTDNDVRSDSAVVELCINNETSPMQSLESSMSSYDSMMQSLHEELNGATPNLGDVEDVDFFSMDCATASSFDYDMNFTIKHLKHIAAYYGLKCKTRKADLIQDIVRFEMDDKNGDAVSRRKRLFHYMDTLKHDEYFKSYVIM
jgi:hypothetical protein